MNKVEILFPAERIPYDASACLRNEKNKKNQGDQKS